MDKVLKDGEKILQRASPNPESIWNNLARSKPETVLERCLQAESNINKFIQERKNQIYPETVVQVFQTALQVKRNQSQERVLPMLLDIDQGFFRSFFIQF